MPPRGTQHHTPSEQKLGYQLKSFFRLWPYLWPKDKPSYKIRTFLAFLLTLAGQFILVGAPFFLGLSVDAVKEAEGVDSVFASDF